MQNIIKLDQLREMMGRKTPDLITREAGRKAFPILEEALRQTPVGDILVLDADKIILIDGSFFDEAILNLFEKLIEGEFNQRYLVLANPTPDSLDNIRGAIKIRNLKTAFPITSNGRLQLIGSLEPNLEETAKILTRKGELTARDLADTLDIGISNASNRLRRLSELRLAKRSEESDETGKYHRYYAIS